MHVRGSVSYDVQPVVLLRLNHFCVQRMCGLSLQG